MLRWTAAALADLEQILQYTNQFDSTLTVPLGRAIGTACSSLETFPFLGKPGRTAGTREYFIVNYPFVLIYRVKNDVPEILRLKHSRQQWP